MQDESVPLQASSINIQVTEEEDEHSDNDQRCSSARQEGEDGDCSDDNTHVDLLSNTLQTTSTNFIHDYVHRGRALFAMPFYIYSILQHTYNIL